MFRCVEVLDYIILDSKLYVVNDKNFNVYLKSVIKSLKDEALKSKYFVPSFKDEFIKSNLFYFQKFSYNLSNKEDLDNISFLLEEISVSFSVLKYLKEDLDLSRYLLDILKVFGFEVLGTAYKL